MANMTKRTYFEMRIPYDGDILETAVALAESSEPNTDFLLYELEEEIMLGMDVAASVEVRIDKTILHTSTEYKSFDNEDISDTISAALSEVPVADWHLYGFANFDLARYLHGLEVTDTDRPLIRMFVPKAEAHFTPGSVLLRALESADLDALRTRFEAVINDADGSTARLRAKADSPGMDVGEVDDDTGQAYEELVLHAMEDIAAHRYREVILSRSMTLPCQVDLAASYLKARQANTPARSFFLDVDDEQVFGLSPETFVEVADRKVYATPLAGTRALKDDVRESLRLREDLVSDAKEIAKHAISVYLSFDELTMVCDPDSVKVSQFMLVALRGSVQHLASRLEGELLSGCNPWHAFCALFPAATASGVPKREAIEAIGRLEPESRGLYSGGVFVGSSAGLLDGALVLRSLYQNDERSWLQAGAGIMNLSSPARELEETREKFDTLSKYLVQGDVCDASS